MTKLQSRHFLLWKTSATWTARIVLRFQKKVSETTWFSGQNTFIDNWHIVDGISRNRLYTFPRIFQKYVKSTKMENVGLLLSPSKFKKLKLRSFIIAVLFKDKTVISRKNQIFVIIAWTVNMLIMAGWRVLVLFLHCPDGVMRCALHLREIRGRAHVLARTRRKSKRNEEAEQRRVTKREESRQSWDYVHIRIDHSGSAWRTNRLLMLRVCTTMYYVCTTSLESFKTFINNTAASN